MIAEVASRTGCADAETGLLRDEAIGAIKLVNESAAAEFARRTYLASKSVYVAIDIRLIGDSTCWICLLIAVFAQVARIAELIVRIVEG